jgi:hypothetical protein
MGLSLVLIAVGIALIVIGYLRARRPWARYQDLKAQDENVARYEAWRGGVREPGQTGASVAMDMARRQALIGAAVGLAGIVVLLVGFFVR